MTIKTVADLTVETLQQAGVKRIYGLVGDSLNGITEAIRKRGVIDWIHVRHEEVAAFAAGAEAQLTGELAVCAGSCGPGNLHLINGLFDCNRTRLRFWPSPRIFRRPRSARTIFRKPIPSNCSGSAASTANWSRRRTSCHSCWRPRCARRSGVAALPSS